jgi:hypothetical protein
VWVNKFRDTGFLRFGIGGSLEGTAVEVEESSEREPSNSCTAEVPCN